MEIEVRQPDPKTLRLAELHYARKLREAIEAGAPLEATWDRDREALLRKRLVAGALALARGGIQKSEAKVIAEQMRRDRQELFLLMQPLSTTAWGIAQQEKFAFLVATCTVHADTGMPYYRDVQDYLSRANDPVDVKAEQSIAKMVFGWRGMPPEEVFLSK